MTSLTQVTFPKYSGTAHVKVDSKWRLKIPSDYAFAVGADLFLIPYFSKQFLLGGDRSDYISLREKAESDSERDVLYQRVHWSKMSDQNRFVLPSTMRGQFGLNVSCLRDETSAVFLGTGNYFLIMSKNTHASHINETDSFLSSLINRAL